MSKIFISVLILATVSAALCKEPWQCDNYGRISCLQSQTCCRARYSSYGYACYPYQNGVCCPDGVTACPNGTICNMNDKRCDKKATLGFLEDAKPATMEDAQVPKLNSVVPLEESEQFDPIDPQDFVTFVKGVNEGFGFFYNLDKYEQCEIIDPKITKLAQDIFDVVKGLNIKNAINVIKKVIKKGHKIIDLISKLSDACKSYALSLKNALARLISKTGQLSYPSSLTYHAITNMSSITDNTMKAVEAFKSKDYKNAGVTGGDLMKFIFFWDL